MKLGELIQGIGRLKDPAFANLEITDITHDSRKVQHGSLFVAIEGGERDGHQYIAGASQIGAVAVVTRQPEKGPCCLPIVEVEEPRKAMAQMARLLYGNPDRVLKVIGITGTNGKTTCSFLVNHLLRTLGQAGRIGTLSYFNGVSEEKAARTTPESSDIFRLLGEMVRNRCRYASIEVSSHGLMYDRILGLELRYAIFTNLSRDHLDFHGDMDSYFRAKHKQFDHLVRGGVAVVNWDDPYGRRIKLPPEVSLLRFGQSREAELRFEVVRMHFKGSTFRVWYEGRDALFEMPLLGRHNIYNLVCAMAVALKEGLSLEDIQRETPTIRPVPGRCEILDLGQKFCVIIDFAHTPDALRKVLEACRELNPSRLIVVFGAGGDRDKSKRSKMGAIVDELADLVFLTSDNPRSEDPEAIMDMVQEGILRTPGPTFLRNWDRLQAISEALNTAGDGDVVIIAGKGHETTQKIGNEIIPFNDRSIAARIVQKRMDDSSHG